MWRTAVLVLLLMVAGLRSAAGQDPASEMQAGVQAYSSAMYERAIAHFQKALLLDSSLTLAHLYLAVAYAQMYIPGADSADNKAMGANALREFKLVLAEDTSPEQRLQALQGAASLNFNMKHFEAAREYYEQALAIDADNAETYYSIGVIDWTESYAPRMELRSSTNVALTEEITSVSTCVLLRSMNQKKVEDGIERLQKAIELRCDYDDAMAYLNLMYREKADYECDDPEQRLADLKLADEWVDRTMAVKKARAEQAAADAAAH